MLVLTINRNPYMASPMALSNLTLTDLERSVKVTQIFSIRISVWNKYVCQQ